MPQAVDSNTSELEQVTARLHDLERRVAALEGHPQPSVPGQLQTADALSKPAQEPKPSDTGREFPAIKISSGVVPIFGKAVLGIAGAYLLRAIAEAGPVPKLPVLLAAIVYAALWMVWAVRAHDTNRFASVAYGMTSVLILAPLLWESTVRFRVISASFAAIVLVAYVAFALALSWRRQLQLIPWIASVAAVVTALALIVATHNLVALAASILAVAALTEIAACLEYPLSCRAVPALAADFAVWLLVDLLTAAEGVPEGYDPASPITISILCSALIAIYGVSIGVRVFAHLQKISSFEMVQGVLAFTLATFGVLRATKGTASGVTGVLCLALSAACYWGALWHFASESYSRNRRVCAIWAPALLLAGTFLVFSAEVQVPFLCLGALAAAFFYSSTRKLSLGLHVSFYLAAAAAVSPLPAFGVSALAGAVPSAPSWVVWIIVIAALLCYLVGGRVRETRIQSRGLWVVPGGLFSFASAAIIVVLIVKLAGGPVELTPPRLSVIRTIVNCGLAFVLGFAGLRWKRVELGWLAYAAVAFGTLKLLLEDMRFGNAASLVVSLLCYGSILILLPRLTRRATAKA